MKMLKKFSLVLFALLMLTGLVAGSVQPAAAAPETAATCQEWHTVQRGEYLVLIARLYNTDWRTLAEINNLQNPTRIYSGQKLCVSMSGSGSTPSVVVPTSNTGVRVYAMSVEEDQFVTLSGKKLLANTRYLVYLNRYGASSTSTILAGAAYTDQYGAFTRTFRLPSKLVDVPKIAVTVTNGSGDRATNWFINANLEDNTGGTGAPALGISTVSVHPDEWVKIRTINLPANVPFDVLMGKAGSKGANGILVGSLVDDDGGGVRATFDIPSDLEGKSKIDIRLENKALGIYTYLTFEN